MTKTLRLVLGDQLSPTISSLSDLQRDRDVVLIAELADEATYVKHHKKKIAFLFSAMRHFAEELIREGVTVDYFRLDERDGPRSFTQAIRRAIERHRPTRLVVTEPGEWRLRQIMSDWPDLFGCTVEIRADDRFLCSHEAFREWAAQYKGGLRMEFFYRVMRRTTGYLMRDDGPEGGQWNLDHDNREKLPKHIMAPARPTFPPDQTTSDVIELVADRFSDHFGDLEPFDYPVTRTDAHRYLGWFIDHTLPNFGRYQDAMRHGEPLLFHSHLSALINCGLLDPRECCLAAERAYHAGAAPLNSVEGFIRQIIGWREYVRGVYWLKMPGYAGENRLDAHRALPGFFWTGDTRMNCMAQAIGDTWRTAYAHHIQRLMIIGNFCLLAGMDPKQVQEWYLLVYHDAYEWVEMPNVVGMILHADGGLLGSKPYAASGAYIDRMSDYCEHCAYSVKKKAGPDACPFNYLYWDFIARNKAKLSSNQRMKMPYATLARMEPRRLDEVRADASTFLDGLGADGPSWQSYA